LPQHLLDPNDVSGSLSSESWVPDGPLPLGLRSFGYYPDVDSMQPGDLILVSPAEVTGISGEIISTQERGGYTHEDARWCHAAVYAGAKIGLCEATRRGVRAELLNKYVGSHLFRVRRDLSLTREVGWEIVAHALLRLNSPYSYFADIKLFLQAKHGGLWARQDKSAHQPDALICSQLYSDAYSMATGKTLWNSIGKEVTPAYLSQTAALTDVKLQWRKIG
jgi:hypothetical protein